MEKIQNRPHVALPSSPQRPSDQSDVVETSELRRPSPFLWKWQSRTHVICKHKHNPPSTSSYPMLGRKLVSDATVVLYIYFHQRAVLEKSWFKKNYKSDFFIKSDFLFKSRDVNGTWFSRVLKKFPVPGKKISRSGGFREIAIIEVCSVFVRALLV